MKVVKNADIARVVAQVANRFVKDGSENGRVTEAKRKQVVAAAPAAERRIMELVERDVIQGGDFPVENFKHQFADVERDALMVSLNEAPTTKDGIYDATDGAHGAPAYEEIRKFIAGGSDFEK